MFLDVIDSFRASFWFAPAAFVLAAVVVAMTAISADRAFVLTEVLPWLEPTSPESARSVLATLTGSIITLTGTVFSIVIVALTLASSQYGPRLLRGFMRDRGNQYSLGILCGSFVYCLLVLNSIGSRTDAVFVPDLAMFLALVTALVDVGVLIFFIHHVATSIHASNIIADVATELSEHIDRLFPEDVGDAPAAKIDEEQVLHQVRALPGYEITAIKSGYLRLLARDDLIEIAVEEDCVIDVRYVPGDFVVAGQRLATMVRAAAPSDEVLERLQGMFSIGVQRTPVQDLNYSLDRLVEVALRALSPGINDPATATSCVHRLGASLTLLARRQAPSSVRCDEDGNPRVLIQSLHFGRVVESAFGRILRHADGQPEVHDAIRDMLSRIVEIAPKRHETIAETQVAEGVGLELNAG